MSDLRHFEFLHGYTKESDPVSEIDGKLLWDTLNNDLREAWAKFGGKHFLGGVNTLTGNDRTIRDIADYRYISPNHLDRIATECGYLQVACDESLEDGRIIVTRTTTRTIADFTVSVDKTDWPKVAEAFREEWGTRDALPWSKLSEDHQEDYFRATKAAVAEYLRQEAANA